MGVGVSFLKTVSAPDAKSVSQKMGGKWGTEQDIESPDQLVIVLSCTPRMNGDKFSENCILSTEILGGQKPGSHTLVQRVF